MSKTPSLAALAVLLLYCGWASPGRSADPQGGAVDPDQARFAAERLLGQDDEAAQQQSYLPFSRQRSASGVVRGSLADSTAAAGVPPAAMLEALQAFAAALDPDRDVHDGDKFYVRFERTFTSKDHPIGIGRVLWAELKTAAKGTIAIHRFRALKASTDTFWLANGRATTTAPPLQLPLTTISVSSGFGMRADPFDQPWVRKVAMGPLGRPLLAPANRPSSSSAPQPSPLNGGSGSGNSGNGADKVNVPTALGLSSGLAPVSARYAPPGAGTALRTGQPAMFMHEGVDLVAAPGTAIFAAGDGVVVGAEPRGRYGNWIEIEHEATLGGATLATVYGHLSGFAHGIAPGVHVSRGDLIGFTGTTGRTTGPHLHFEILTDGRPGNPIGHPATKRAQLSGPDLERFRRQVARELQERERESKAM
jgi:murein DD-endopeptidase MepM/ murein hydrolase activator NlpD